MEFINKVEICGRVGRVTSSTIDGKSVCNFSVCVDTATSSNGALLVDVTWFNVTYWQDSPNELVKKGDAAHVWGRFRMRRYVTPDNEEHTIYEILADNVVIEDKTEE